MTEATPRRGEKLGGWLMLVGTQGDEPGRGIVAARLDKISGSIVDLGLAAEARRPTWVMRDARRDLVLAVNELGNAGDREGAVQSFAVERDSGRLRPISEAGSAGGGPTHLALTPDGKTLFVANFGGGQVAALPVAQDGTLGPATSVQTNSGSGPHRRQTGPHAHGVTLDPSGRFLLAPDMGADRVFVYRFDAEQRALAAGEPPYIATPPGSGPRLILFGMSGRFAYLLTELSAEILVYRWADGRLSPIDAVALDPPEHEGDRSAAAFVMSRDGRHLYASNRRTDTIHVFAIDAESGLLRQEQRIDADGVRPWSATFSPDDRWLVVTNQGSDSVTAFSVDRDSGRLSPVATELAVPAPTSIAFAGEIA